MDEVTQALDAGIQSVMEKAGSKPGEKTVLDALCPALDALKRTAQGDDAKTAFAAAAKAAAAGSESTRGMKPVHGRAVYYGEKSIGMLDAGSVVGRLIFETIESSL